MVRSLLCQFQISSFFSGLVLVKIFLNVSTLADFGVACLVLKHNSSAFVSEDARISLDFLCTLLTLPSMPPLRFHCVGRLLGLNPGLLRHWHWQSDALTPRLDLIQTRLDLIPLDWISSNSAGSHPTRLNLIPHGLISSHPAGSHPTRLDLIPLG